MNPQEYFEQHAGWILLWTLLGIGLLAVIFIIRLRIEAPGRRFWEMGQKLLVQKSFLGSHSDKFKRLEYANRVSSWLSDYTEFISRPPKHKRPDALRQHVRDCLMPCLIDKEENIRGIAAKCFFGQIDRSILEREIAVKFKPRSSIERELTALKQKYDDLHYPGSDESPGNWQHCADLCVQIRRLEDLVLPENILVRIGDQQFGPYGLLDFYILMFQGRFPETAIVATVPIKKFLERFPVSIPLRLDDPS